MCGCLGDREGGARTAMARRTGMPRGRTGGASPASDPLENGSPRLDYEVGARVERGAGFGDKGDGVVINAPLDMDGVCPRRIGDDGAGLDDAAHGLVLGDLPGDLDRLGWHTTAGFERFGREAGPQDAAVGEWVAGCEAQGKWIRR